MDKKVFIGISGGIDSAASVLLLKEQGYDVVGVYLQIVKPLEDKHFLEQQLGIKIIIDDVGKEFSTLIVDDFLRSYSVGQTPSPCVECNHKIKWRKLYEIAKRNGGGLIATGHYCQKQKVGDKFYVSRAVDNSKDQSYYLWGLEQDILSQAIFPLGNCTKQYIYEFMRSKGCDYFVNKPQSMSICFMNGKKLPQFLSERLSSNLLKIGDIIDSNGKIVGVHNGFPLYTIAQKKGLELPNGTCVTAIDANQNRLTVGSKEELYRKNITIRNWRFTDLSEVQNATNMTVTVRGIGRNPSGTAKVHIISDTLAEVELTSPAWAVASGQPVVFYIEERVVGGAYCK